MITPTIMIPCQDDNSFLHETKKPWNNENIARCLGRMDVWTDGQWDGWKDGHWTARRTDTLAYSDARTRLKIE